MEFLGIATNKIDSNLHSEDNFFLNMKKIQSLPNKNLVHIFKKRRSFLNIKKSKNGHTANTIMQLIYHSSIDDP
jgi:hypothetical protein